MDYTAWDDRQCFEAIADIRTRRTALGIPPARFVSKINRAGYSITVTEYRTIENAPLRGRDHVRAGFLDAAERAFEPMPQVHQDANIRKITETLAQYRRDQSLTYEQVADIITDRGYPITRDEYRSIEQGTTKRVSLDVVIHAAAFLRIPAHELFPELDA